MCVSACACTISGSGRRTGKCNFLCRKEGGEGSVVWVDAEQITLPAVEDSGHRPQSGLLFWNTHTHVLTQKKEGAGWLQTLCAGIFALIQFFLKHFTGAVVRPAFTKIPRHSCLILCLCRSVCVHISKFCNFVQVTRSPMSFCTSVFLLCLDCWNTLPAFIKPQKAALG